MMSFSSQFNSVEEYFVTALRFLEKYHWIYSTKNTHIITNDILSKIPNSWTDYLNNVSLDVFHELVLGNVPQQVPQDLKAFFSELHLLRPTYEEPNKIEEPPADVFVGVNPKKIHEILSLAPVVDELCKNSQCDLVVDIGSGLGYLSHLLHKNYGYSVLGLDVSKKCIELAYKNQNKFYPQSRTNVIFSELLVEESSIESIEDLVKQHFGSTERICFTGLHACADLSITISRLFSKMKSVKAMAIMPCCYHRISVGTQCLSGVKFKNFPCSDGFGAIFEQYCAETFLQVPFLRLACQETLESFLRMGEEDLARKSRELMFRAVLELVAENENCSASRLRRKSGKLKVADVDEGFETYLNNLPRSHELRMAPSDVRKPIDDAFLRQMKRKWLELKSLCRAAGVFVGLQAALQAICENVVLLDRVQMLEEAGLRCRARRITDSSLSPRCWVLVATKSDPDADC